MCAKFVRFECVIMSSRMAIRLVERAAEVQKVQTALERGRPVLITGAAGVGKTALARAALRDMPLREGGALRSFSHVPFFALTRALGQQLEGSVDVVAAAVLAAVAGAVLFVDDLHWADSSTIELLASVAPLMRLVVTARPHELPAGATALLDRSTVVDVPLLTRRGASALVERLGPALAERDRAAIVRMAGGNPLMVQAFVDTGAAPSLLAAVAGRLGALSPQQRREVARLALLGRPDPSSTPRHDDVDPFVVDAPDGAAIRHPLLADAIVESLSDDERRSLHAGLADELAGAESIRHHVDAGEPARALASAATLLGGRLEPTERAEVLRLRALATDAVERDADAWVEAATALVEVGRCAEGAGAAGRALEVDGRARWFTGDIDGAEAAFTDALERAPEGDRGRLRVLLEHAYLRVRDRRPEATTIAHEAFALAEQLDAEQPRASSVLGAALLYDGTTGWRELLTDAIDGATAAGDEELAATAAYHLVSGLGFMGHLDEAAGIARERSRAAHRAGLDTWAVHFDAVDLYNRVLMGEEPSRAAAECQTFLEANPTFRNHFQIELGLTLSLADADDLTAAHAAADRASSRTSGAESEAFALLANVELAWVERDVDTCAENAFELRKLGDVWFGIRIAAEVAAADLCDELGRPFVASTPSTLLPVLWPALHEVEGWELRRKGDASAAAEAFALAADGWTRHEMPRFAVRAHHAAHRVAGRSTRRGRSHLEAAVAIAREHSLVGHLRRLGVSSTEHVTAREEEVLRLVARGLTSAAIAQTLGISRATVDDHVKRARTKLGAASRLEAAHRRTTT